MLNNESTESPTNNEKLKTKLVFRMSDTGPPLLKQVCLDLGWAEYNEHSTNDKWNLWWKGSRFSQKEHDQLTPTQRINHFKNTTTLTKKDCLFRLLKTMSVIYTPQIYSFFPQTFTLPNEYLKFVKQYALEEGEKGGKTIWICKPVDMSRGRGIFLVRELKDLTYDTSLCVQRYVERPFLVGGYKFDLRCYVVVRSFHPLVIYIYKEGIVRFATNKYTTENLTNPYCHLTNTSINKHSPTLAFDKELVGEGCRWTLKQLRGFFLMSGIDYDKIWKRIEGIVLLSLIPIANDVTKHSKSCFELFGFDILIDEDLKPWLLEVNLSPALATESNIDILVKKPLLTDIIKLVNLQPTTFQPESPPNLKKKIWRKSPHESQNDLRQRKAVRVDSNKKEVLEKSVGGFELIYPFNGYEGGLKVGEAGTRSLIMNVKNEFFT